MNRSKQKNFEKVISCLTKNIGDVLRMIPDVDSLCELRLRADSPIVLIFTYGRRFITSSGRLSSFYGDNLLSCSKSDVDAVFNSLCGYSVHSFEECLANGYITVGGNRVGIYGTAVTSGGRVVSVRNVKGLNFRISGSFPDVAKPIAESVFSRGIANVLICGPPSSGKTTLLKDLARILSQDRGLTVSVIDERDELCRGSTSLCDVLSGYPKAVGIQIAVRTLSPDIIVCDEIGTSEEIDAVADGLNCGAGFVMSIHCKGKSELAKKPQFKALRRIGAVDYCVLLGEGKCKIDSIIPIGELEDEIDCVDRTGDLLCACRSVHGAQT